jgi:hypothetical protein
MKAGCGMLRVVLAAIGVSLALGTPGWGDETGGASTDTGPVPLFPVVKDGKWGYMDAKGKVVIEPQYEAAYDFSEGLACVIANNWRGYINRTGAMVIKPEFAWAGKFTDGFAPVYNEKSGFAGRPQFYRPTSGRFCCIDRTGKVQKRIGCSTAGFREGKAIGGRGKSFVCTDGTEVKTDADQLCLFAEGLAPARKGMTWGYVDHSAQWVIEPQFHDVDDFSQGLAGVAKADPPPPEKGARWNWRRRCKFTWGFCDKSGKMVIDLRFEDVWPYSEDFASVRKGGKWGYIDKTGKMVIEPAYDYVWPFSEGMARVLVGEKQGYIDKTGKMVIEPRFRPGWEFSQGLARVGVKDGGEYREGYIDKNGTYVWEPSR